MKKTILWVLLGWPITWLAAQPAVLDYRPLQSPVKNQGYRNTCTGFAVAACLEVLPGVPADVSEQHLYAGLKMLEYQKTDPVDQGGLLNLYPQTIARYGVLPESRMPYDSTQRIFSDTDHNLVQVVRESQSGPVSMLMQAGKAKITVDPQDCEVGEFDEKVSVAYIKKLLAQGIKAIGVGYYVNDYWFDWDKKPGLLITPDSVGGFVDTSRNITTFKALKQQYGEGAFAQINSLFAGPTGRRWYYSSNRPPQGHAVTIVGYNRDGFIIKNSWGSGWGHQGYATVSYDYHRLFAKRMVAIKKVRFTPQAQLPLTPLADLRLKLVPVNGMRGGIQVSLFCMNDGYDPLITQVEYALYQLNNGQKTLLDKRLSLPGLVEYDPSFTTVLLKDKGLPPLPKLPRPQLIIEAVLTGGSTAQRITQTFRHIQWANTEYRSEVK